MKQFILTTFFFLAICRSGFAATTAAASTAAAATTAAGGVTTAAAGATTAAAGATTAAAGATTAAAGATTAAAGATTAAGGTNAATTAGAAASTAAAGTATNAASTAAGSAAATTAAPSTAAPTVAPLSCRSCTGNSSDTCGAGSDTTTTNCTGQSSCHVFHKTYDNGTVEVTRGCYTFEGTTYACTTSSNGYGSEYCQSASGGSTLCYQCCTTTGCNTQQLTGGVPATRQSITIMIATCLLALLATMW